MSDVFAALKAVSESFQPEAIQHRLEGLVRSTGSFVPGLSPSWEATRAFLEGLDWEEVAWDSLPEGAGIPVARYFRATGSAGVRNTMSVAEARARGIELESRVHKPDPTGKSPNPRGLGIFADHKAEDVQVQTDEVWIILGPFGDLVVPWTWHPGPPAVPVTKRHYDALESGKWDDPGMQDVNVHLQQ